MNVITLPRRPDPAATRILRAGSPLVLGAIDQPGVAATIWQRQLPDGMVPWLQSLAPERLPRLRHALRPDQVASAMQAACIIARTPAGHQREALIDDVAMLVHCFASVMAETTVQLRLEMIRGDACRRFHVDRVRARLLCCYCGPGTELADAPLTDTPSPAATERIATDRIAQGEVAILRGSLWSGQPIGLWHRSPPIAASGLTRLLLAVDPILPEQ